MAQVQDSEFQDHYEDSSQENFRLLYAANSAPRDVGGRNTYAAEENKSRVVVDRPVSSNAPLEIANWTATVPQSILVYPNLQNFRKASPKMAGVTYGVRLSGIAAEQDSDSNQPFRDFALYNESIENMDQNYDEEVFTDNRSSDAGGDFSSRKNVYPSPILEGPDTMQLFPPETVNSALHPCSDYQIPDVDDSTQAKSPLPEYAVNSNTYMNYMSTSTGDSATERARASATSPDLQDRSHYCDLCPSRFGRKGDLKRHYRIHFPGTRTFHCFIGGCHRNGRKAFFRRDKLRDHQKKVHSGWQETLRNPSVA